MLSLLTGQGALHAKGERTRVLRGVSFSLTQRQFRGEDKVVVLKITDDKVCLKHKIKGELASCVALLRGSRFVFHSRRLALSQEA